MSHFCGWALESANANDDAILNPTTVPRFSHLLAILSFLFFSYMSVFLQLLIIAPNFHISSGHCQVCLGNTKLVSGFLLPFLSYPPSPFISLAPVWPSSSYFSIKILYIFLNQLMASEVSPFGRNISTDSETLRVKALFLSASFLGAHRTHLSSNSVQFIALSFHM